MCLLGTKDFMINGKKAIFGSYTNISFLEVQILSLCGEQGPGTQLWTRDGRDRKELVAHAIL